MQTQKWMLKFLIASILLVVVAFIHFMAYTGRDIIPHIASYKSLISKSPETTIPSKPWNDNESKVPIPEVTAKTSTRSSTSSLNDTFSETYRSRVASRLNLPTMDDPRRGCVMPKLKKYNEAYIKKGYKGKSQLVIKCREEADWLEVSNGVVSFSQKALEKYKGNMRCTINFMQRIDDFKQIKKQPAVVMDSSTGKTLPLEDDFLFADCVTTTGKNETWNDLLAGVKVKQEVLERQNRDFTPSVTSMTQDKPEPVNILMFGFDSVSHVNFVNKLPKLYSYLVNDLEGIVLDSHNTVGDGTTAQLLAIFTGQYEDQLKPDTRRGKTHETVDSHPWIFKEFKRNRYTTVYAEDLVKYGTFQWRHNGFKDQPTDHYMRQFQRQAEEDGWDLKKHPDYCLGSKLKLDILMGWLEEVFKMYPSDVGKFIFGFHSEYSHMTVEEVALADEPVTEWIKGLKESGKLSNTILMIMSDHGHRFSFTRSTLQGKYEERLPFFSIILPKWFKLRFPNSYRALQMNAADRLTTHFDIYETFKTILYHINEGIDVGSVAHDKNNMTRGLSLFQEIPLERSCVDAKISNHYCACNSWVSVDSEKDILVRRAAEAIVNSANELVKESDHYNECETLQINYIKRAQKMMPQKDLLAYKKSKDWDGYTADLSDNTTVSVNLNCFAKCY